MEKTESLAQAVAMLQTRLPEIKKSQTANAGTYSYNYADLPQITGLLMPILGDLGLSFMTKPTLIDGQFVLAYKLLHVSGEVEEGVYPLPPSGNPQAMGSAITYARRYCLCAVTGIAAEEDDDGAAAQAATQTQRDTQGRTSRTRQRPQTNGQQAARHEPPAAPPPSPADEGGAINQPQMRKMHALFGQVEWTDRADRLRAASAIVGRELESSTDLTRDEASKVIDTLGRIAADPDPAMRLTELVGATASSEGGE